MFLLFKELFKEFCYCYIANISINSCLLTSLANSFRTDCLTSRPILSKPWKPLSALLSKSKIMELVNWSLNAIDRIFSTRSPGSGEPVCPGGMYAAGYMRNSWEEWRVVCLAILSVEDIEDLYIFGTVISGFLLIGLGIALVYRKIRKTVTAVQIPTLPDIIDGVSKAVSTL